MTIAVSDAVPLQRNYSGARSPRVIRISCSGSGSPGTSAVRKLTNPVFSYALIAATFETDGPITQTSRP